MKLLKEGIEELLASERIERCDFHTHSFLSDGVLLPIEQFRRAHVMGHKAYSITDHASAANLDIIEKVTQDCLLAMKQWGLVAIPGIELTHVPTGAIDEIAQKARDLGALIVVLHGETIAEPVEPGTNLIGSKSKNIDILAHPGLLTKQEANNCRKNDIFVEITSNKSHSITNGHIVNVGRNAKVDFLQNTDTHKPQDMLTYESGERVLYGAGLSPQESEITLQRNVRKILTKILNRL